MATAIQFFGKENVITMAENRDCPRWGIFNGRQFLFKFDQDSAAESIAFLDKILTALEESETDAIYTIKFYDDSVKIKENTPCDGSFNFKLIDPQVREERKEKYSMGATRNTERIDRMEAALQMIIDRLQDPEEEEEEEEQPNTLNGILLGLLKEPEKIASMIGAFRTLLGAPGAIKAIGNVPPVPAAHTEEDKKIGQAVEILKAHDPKLGDHLLKLAAIAQTDPGAWKFLISTLESK